jgi:hypothetical protein
VRLIESTAAGLAGEGWVLRTGLSPGADQAFYRGARSRGGTVELYLPWPGFEAQAREPQEGREVSELAQPSQDAYALAARFYPVAVERPFEKLCAARQARLARDSHEVLGADLARPVCCVICWTPDGDVDGRSAAEGTGQALRIARCHGIRAYNLARAEHVDLVAALWLRE